MILVYLSLSILVMYIYFLISRVGDIFDSIEKGVDITKDVSKFASDSYKNKKILIKELIKLVFNSR